MKKQHTTNRRAFIQKSTITASGLTAAIQSMNAPAVLAAANVNDQLRVGFIGVGNRGSQLLAGYMKQDDVRIEALCDVYQPYLDRAHDRVDKEWLDELGGRVPRMGEKFGHEVKKYTDFRRLLDDKDIDAVTIATPDHWHAFQAIMAMRAGKDVYVEKPLSVAISEGRRMVEVAKETGRVVQVGLHRRSSKTYNKVHELVRDGIVGKVTVARAYRISNMYPNGIGHKTKEKPVKGFDWNMWLGPRADIEFQENISPYRFRWWNAYSSQIANWGVHYFDGIRWILDELAPSSISSHGGQFVLKDDRKIPDTMETIFEFDSGLLLIFGQYEANGGRAIEHGELEFRGTLGNLFTASEGGGYTIIPSTPGQFQEWDELVKPVEARGLDGDLTEQHIRNFVDCVKSRKKPNCDIETGHRSTTFALLANMALATKHRLDWDAKAERVTNHEAANELMSYEYRKPWSLDI